MNRGLLVLLLGVCMLVCTLSGAMAKLRVPDMKKPFGGVSPVKGKLHILTICWDPHRPGEYVPSKTEMETLIFGAKNSVRGYFLENSAGKLDVQSAGVLGWYDADYPGDYYWRDPADVEDNLKKWGGSSGVGEDGKPFYVSPSGFVSGHCEKWTEAIRKAAKDIDFKQFDTNHDGYLSPHDELTILIVIPQNGSFGTQRGTAGREYPKFEDLMVDGVKIDTMVEAYIGNPPHLGLCVHELSHIMLNAPDMYIGGPYRPGQYSLMDAHWNNTHLDPHLKIRLGWIKPRVVTKSGSYTLKDIETKHEAIILCDPKHGTDEYFIIENRWPGDSYDKALPDTGLAVWHIIENLRRYEKLAMPPNVTPELWQSITNPDDWGRSCVRLIRSVTLPGIDDRKTLFDGADTETGYDLLDQDSNPAHATLKWADGSPSGFSVLQIPKAGPVMNLVIRKRNSSQ